VKSARAASTTTVSAVFSERPVIFWTATKEFEKPPGAHHLPRRILQRVNRNSGAGRRETFMALLLRERALFTNKNETKITRRVMSVDARPLHHRRPGRTV